MKRESGFSLVELLVAMTVMLLISGAAVTAILKLSTTQSTIWNRTQMHSGIRGATEVLQQEVGQAGRISLVSGSATCVNASSTPCLSAGVIAGATSATVTSICGMYIGQKLLVDVGPNTPETVAIATIAGAAADPTSTQCPTGSTILPGTITTTTAFAAPHGQYAPLQALGGFIQGVIPYGITNGSTEAVLKLFGDVNADGNMVYVEYSVSPACICTSTCIPSTQTGNLYRNSMSWNSATKTPASASQILLGNVTQNPNSSACFTYQQKLVPWPAGGGNDTYVTDVAVTLTVQTQILDPVTKTYQTETKALLNVSPRNVFNTWELANDGYADRNQGTPLTITTLIAGPS